MRHSATSIVRTACIVATALCLSLCFWWRGPARAVEEAPKPQDFAFGFPIDTGGGGAVFEVALPVDLYRGVARSDGSDLCVFNGLGEAVPFAVRPPSKEAPAKPVMIAFPFFPVPGEPGKALDGARLRVRRSGPSGQGSSRGGSAPQNAIPQASAPQPEAPQIVVQQGVAPHAVAPQPAPPGREGLELRVRPNGAETVIIVEGAGVQGEESGTAAYLIDASALQKPLKTLVLAWKNEEEPFVGSVSVQGSDDLEKWTPVATGKTLASLRYGEYSLLQNKIQLPSVRYKYLAVSWPENMQQVALDWAGAELESEKPEPAREWTSMTPTVKEDRPGEYLFMSPGPVPTDRVRIGFPQKNTLVAAELLSRSDEKQPWRTRSSGMIYNLSVEGEELVNADFAFAPTMDRFWMLKVRQSGGGLGSGSPGISLAWIPQRLFFVARGEGPFLLAFGNARSKATDLRVDDLLARFTTSSKENLAVKPAALGQKTNLGGSYRLKPPSPINVRTYVLWAVLLLAVLLLGWMSFRLYRQMNSQSGSDSGEEPR